MVRGGRLVSRGGLVLIAGGAGTVPNQPHGNACNRGTKEHWLRPAVEEGFLRRRQPRGPAVGAVRRRLRERILFRCRELVSQPCERVAVAGCVVLHMHHVPQAVGNVGDRHASLVPAPLLDLKGVEFMQLDAVDACARLSTRLCRRWRLSGGLCSTHFESSGSLCKLTLPPGFGRPCGLLHLLLRPALRTRLLCLEDFLLLLSARHQARLKRRELVLPNEEAAHRIFGLVVAPAFVVPVVPHRWRQFSGQVVHWDSVLHSKLRLRFSQVQAQTAI